jgi:hypothetical protein
MILTLDSVLRKVMAQANAEQNQHYPPAIFTEHFNLATSWLIDEIMKVFPGEQHVVDLVSPFMETADVIVKNGKIPFPKNYRHYTGMAIFTTPDYKSACGCDEAKENQTDVFSTISDADIILEKKAKRICIAQDVKLVDIDSWNNLTLHPYKQPTLQKPIACIFQGDGIKICPQPPSVEMRYIRQPKIYNYGYTMLPDDSYQVDPKTTIESEWNDNAASYLFRAINTLYSGYVRDPEQRDLALQLTKIGLF